MVLSSSDKRSVDFSSLCVPSSGTGFIHKTTHADMVSGKVCLRNVNEVSAIPALPQNWCYQAETEWVMNNRGDCSGTCAQPCVVDTSVTVPVLHGFRSGPAGTDSSLDIGGVGGLHFCIPRQCDAGVLFTNFAAAGPATPSSKTSTEAEKAFGCIDPADLSDWAFDGTADSATCPGGYPNKVDWLGEVANYPLGHLYKRNEGLAMVGGQYPLHVFKLQRVGGLAGCPDIADAFVTCELGCGIGYTGNNVVYQCQPTPLIGNAKISTSVKLFSTAADQSSVVTKNPKCVEQLCFWHQANGIGLIIM